MSEEEMEDILVWPEPQSITITMIHQDYDPVYTEDMEYNYGDMVRIRHFDPYTKQGNANVHYYVEDNGTYEEIALPFVAVRNLTIIETVEIL